MTRRYAQRAADQLGERGHLGVVAPGAYADLIAVASSPLEDVNALKNVGFVMKNGAVFRATLSSAGK
jgi:imidazolonepropionase-like amidohydrolase